MSGPALVCYDGSAASAAALAAAGRLLSGREAIVCHAWAGLARLLLRRDPADVPAALRGAAEELDAADRGEAARAAAEGVDLAVEAGFRARALPVREHRKTWRTLLAEADRAQAAVIVAGAHGRSGGTRALLGSVSSAIAQHSSRPVLVVPAPAAHGEPRDGPLLLCYDGSEAARYAIEAAARLCVSRRALVLHLWESWEASAPALAGISGPVRGMARELDEIAAGQSSELATEGLQLARAAGFEGEALSERAPGPPWKAVLAAADSHDCAAIVLGTRGLTGLSAALGSVSHGVLVNGHRPVLVVPPG